MTDKELNEILDNKTELNCWNCKHANCRLSRRAGVISIYCYLEGNILINGELIGECEFFKEDDE